MSELLPPDIRLALLKTAKAWILNHYIGDRFMLEAWSDHYAYLTSIHSYNLPGDRRANLKRLDRLVHAGVMTERDQYRKGAVRSFSVPSHVLDEIGREAVREWEAVGYVVGEMMPRLHKREGGAA